MPFLIPDGKATRRLLILVRKLLQPPDRLILRTDLDQKLDITLRILVPRVDLRLVRQRGQGLVERLVHFPCGALEEAAAAAGEEGVAGEDGVLWGAMRAVDDVVADAVLGVAGGVQRGDADGFPDGEGGVVRRRAPHAVAVLAADDGGGAEVAGDLGVAAGVVAVVVRVEDGGQGEGVRRDGGFEGGDDFGGVGWVEDHALLGGLVGDQVGVVVGAADPWVGKGR